MCEEALAFSFYAVSFLSVFNHTNIDVQSYVSANAETCELRKMVIQT